MPVAPGGLVLTFLIVPMGAAAGYILGPQTGLNWLAGANPLPSSLPCQVDETAAYLPRTHGGRLRELGLPGCISGVVPASVLFRALLLSCYVARIFDPTTAPDITHREGLEALRVATSANESKYTKLSRGPQLQSWGLLVVLPTVGVRNIQNQFSPQSPTDDPYGRLDDSDLHRGYLC